jgi:hypothetical protein
MSGKVILPKEVAEAIENLKGLTFTNYGIVSRLHEGGNDPDSNMGILYKHFNASNGGEHPDKLIKALAIGYEVKKSPEEKILETYEKTYKNDAHGRGFADGMIYVLDVLAMKIEGVNQFTAKAHA